MHDSFSVSTPLGPANVDGCALVSKLLSEVITLKGCTVYRQKSIVMQYCKY
jgi:hypothetical protein